MNSHISFKSVLDLCQENTLLATMKQQMVAARSEIGKPFPQEAEFRTKSARLAEVDAELNMDQQTGKDQTKKKEQER